MRLVIAGTDTDVGKTVVSALVTQGLGARYWKPVQSGLADGSDSERVRQLLALPAERILPEAYRFQAPVSPHWAAELEGARIDPAALALPPGEGPLVVECAGGLMVPLRRDGATAWMQIDQLPCWAWCSTAPLSRTTPARWRPSGGCPCSPSCRAWSPSAPPRCKRSGWPASCRGV